MLLHISHTQVLPLKQIVVWSLPHMRPCPHPTLPRVGDHDTVLVIVYWFSKMAHFVPCSKTTSREEMTYLFLNNVARLHGLPEDVTFDRGPQFMSHFCKNLGLLWTCQHHITLKRMSEPRESTKSSNNTSGVQSATNKKIGWISFPWWNLPTIIVSMPRLRFPHSLQTMVSTCVSTFPFLRFPFIRCPSCVPTLYKMSIVTSPLSSVSLVNSIRITMTVVTWPRRPSQSVTWAFRLALPPTFQIHNVFHVSLLELYHPSQIPRR